MVATTSTRRALVTALLLLTSVSVGAADQADVLLLTHPDASWSVRLELPGFESKPPWLFRDRSQVWAEASNRDTGVILTVFVELVAKPREARECRDYYVKKLPAARRKSTLSERGEMALAENFTDLETMATGAQKNLHAYLHREGGCLDLHLSKQPFVEEDQKLFWTVLDHLSIVPATDEERARAASYTLSSGPGEQIVLEAVQKLRQKEFDAAEALLLPLCPEVVRRSSQGSKSAECTLRIAGIADARKIRQGKELADLYWLAGDRLAKNGRPDAALEALRKSIDVYPVDPETWYSIGQVQRDR